MPDKDVDQHKEEECGSRSRFDGCTPLNTSREKIWKECASTESKEAEIQRNTMFLETHFDYVTQFVAISENLDSSSFVGGIVFGFDLLRTTLHVGFVDVSDEFLFFN